MNTMRLMRGCTLSVIALAATAAGAKATETLMPGTALDRAAYACDVFSYAFCFRKSESHTLKQSDGPDFSLYTILDRSGHHQFTVYLGRAPERISSKAEVLTTARSERGEMTLYRMPMDGKDADRFNVVVKYRDGEWAHLFGVRDDASTLALLEALSSFRLCINTGKSSLLCEDKPLLSFEATRKLLFPAAAGN